MLYRAYDGDSKQVQATVNGVTTTYVNQYYEVSGTSVTKYYFAGSTRLAMRKDGTLSFLVGDHLGSSSLVTDASGNLPTMIGYLPWGDLRYPSG